MIKVDFYRDASGVPRAKSDAQQHLVADFLESDVQGDSTLCRELIHRLTHATSGWEWVGNAHSVVLNNDNVYIAGLFEDEQEFAINVQELVGLLINWLSFLQNQTQNT